ncbi:MAG: trypsin-like peptidase domain-containing protein [Clostridia bacterium]|nr:trypsin-like peptidase domain-containing protein [Clostridia bacterium]
MEEKYEGMPEQASGENHDQVQETEQISEQISEQESVTNPAQTEEQVPVQNEEIEMQPAEQAFEQDKQKKAAEAEARTSLADKDAYQYRWNYEEQREADLKNASGKRSHNRGAWVYAGIMTAVFALCFGILLGVLIHDALTPPVSENTTVQGGFAGNVTVVGGGDEQTIEMSALESVRNYTVVITARTADGVGTGTGIVLTQDGYIATNYHVIEDAQTITVKFYNGQSAIAEVIGYSEIDDLAVIKVEATGLYCATLGSSSDIVDSQSVYAVGTPAGEEYAWSVTKGVVSYAQREVKLYDDEGILEKKMKLIQTDTPVNPGNSGGPLVNSNGEVLGIITMKLSGQYENMGFAIPIDGAMVLINNIIETGEPGESPITTKRPLIGIVGVGVEAGKYYINVPGENRIQEVSEEDAKLNPEEVFYAAYTGVWVQSTTPGLDAANKLQPGDIIVLADGQELVSIYDLMNVINQHNGGDTVEITYYRNGVANIVNITLGYAD